MVGPHRLVGHRVIMAHWHRSEKQAGETVERRLPPTYLKPAQGGCQCHVLNDPPTTPRIG